MKQERTRRFGWRTRIFSSGISSCNGDARAIIGGGCRAGSRGGGSCNYRRGMPSRRVGRRPIGCTIEPLGRTLIDGQLILQYGGSDADSWLTDSIALLLMCYSVLVASLRPLVVNWTYTDTRLLLDRSVYKGGGLLSSSSFASQEGFFFCRLRGGSACYYTAFSSFASLGGLLFFVVCVKVRLVTSRLSSGASSGGLLVVCLVSRAFRRLPRSEGFSVWGLIFERSRTTTSGREVETYCNVMGRAWVDCIVWLARRGQ